ncbi:MAG: efflux RND transporter periplasmic adaptor subunit [Cyanophyceae cyanobacterium]
MLTEDRAEQRIEQKELDLGGLQFDSKVDLSEEASQKNTLEKAIAALPNLKSPSRPLVKVLLAIALVGGGATTWTLLNRSGNTDAAPASAAMPPRPVEVTTLQAGDGVQEVELIGEVEAADQATVRSQTSGTVQQVLVAVGDSVRPGQTLAVLDNSDQRLAVAEAQAALASARSQLSRMETGTRPEIVAQRRAELRAAQAREQEAQTNLRNVRSLLPSLVAQRQAELEMAKSAEVEAVDSFQRTRELADTGALSRRALVEAESRANGAKSDRLRAASAVAAQRTENQQRLSQAKAAVDTATSDRLRAAASLAEATAGPRQEDIVAQRGVVRAAQSNVAQAQLQLNRAVITADTAGIISQRPVNTGDYVERNSEILTVVSRDRLDVFLDVPETYSGQVQPGTSVTLSASALPSWEGQATIAGVVPSADAASRRQRVRVRLDSSPQGLLPGMAIAATVEMPVRVEGSQFVVSRDSLTRRLNQWVVFVKEEGQAQEVPVELVTDMGETVAIASPDLRAGQSLVTKGGDGLRDGAPIQVAQN